MLQKLSDKEYYSDLESDSDENIVTILLTVFRNNIFQMKI